MNTEQLQGIPYNSKEITSLLYNKRLKHYQFYNVDFNPNAYAFHNFKKNKYSEDAYDKKLLNKTYYDIEVFIEPGVFPDAEKADRPINAIATYNTIKNISTVYYLKKVEVIENGRFVTHIPKITDQQILQTAVEEGYKTLCDNDPKYIVPNIEIKVLGFDSEIELLKTFFMDRIMEETLFLIGFNSNLFDNPYIFNRLINLLGRDETEKAVSQFGELSNNGKYFKIPDYLLIDLLEMYKPTDQGGGGFGKSLSNFKLQTILQKELKMSKLDLPGGFNENYLNDLPNFLLYNLIDVIPIFKLDTKLQFLELQWSLNSYNNSIMSATTGGRSLMYTFRNNLHYTMENKLLRYTKLNKEIHFEL